MKLRKLAAAVAAVAALTLPAVAASPASASSCNSGIAGRGTDFEWKMEICDGTYGGTVITYYMAYNIPGHFKVWNHDNTSQWSNSIERSPWLYNDQTNKVTPWYHYTCAQFMAYQGNGRWAPIGTIGCLHI